MKLHWYLMALLVCLAQCAWSQSSVSFDSLAAGSHPVGVTVNVHVESLEHGGKLSFSLGPDKAWYFADACLGSFVTDVSSSTFSTDTPADFSKDGSSGHTGMVFLAGDVTGRHGLSVIWHGPALTNARTQLRITQLVLPLAPLKLAAVEMTYTPPSNQTFKNKCSGACNVCDACCEAYIADGAACDACFAESCPARTNTTSPTPAPTDRVQLLVGGAIEKGPQNHLVATFASVSIVVLALGLAAFLIHLARAPKVAGIRVSKYGGRGAMEGSSRQATEYLLDDADDEETGAGAGAHSSASATAAAATAAASAAAAAADTAAAGRERLRAAERQAVQTRLCLLAAVLAASVGLTALGLNMVGRQFLRQTLLGAQSGLGGLKRRYPAAFGIDVIADDDGHPNAGFLGLTSTDKISLINQYPVRGSITIGSHLT
jgi:hypothetical protein